MEPRDPWGPDDDELEPDGKTPEELDQLVELQQALLTSVATGGPRIDDVNSEYIARRRKLIGGLQKLGLPQPFPWRDLWGWYGYWSANLPSYAERRRYVQELSEPVRATLEKMFGAAPVDDLGTDVHGWPALESRLDELKERLRLAASVDDRQDVGRRCREILIDLASVVYTPEMLGEGEEEPKQSDAKVRLTYAARALMAGNAHAEWRSLVRSAWELANKITHSSGVTAVDTFASVQATILLVRTFERAAAEPDG